MSSFTSGSGPVNRRALISFSQFSAVAIIIGGSAIAIALVFASPWVLQKLASVHGLNWSQLSNVGQAYAAAASLLSSFALAGVALSLVIQNREMKVTREQAARSLGGDLVRMGDDPVLRKVVSGSRNNPAISSDTRHRQRLYANQWVVHWQSMHELHFMNDDDVRYVLRRDLFSGDVGRDYWASARERRTPNESRRARRYYRIVDEEYQKAVASGPPERVLPDGSQHYLERLGKIIPLNWKAVALLGGSATVGTALASRALTGRGIFTKCSSRRG